MYAYEYQSPSTRLINKLAQLFEHRLALFGIITAHVLFIVSMVTGANIIGGALSTVMLMVAIIALILGTTIIGLAAIEALFED